MYTVEKILVSDGRIISDIDVTENKVKELLKRYRSIRIVLSHPNLDTLVVGELQDNLFASNYAGTVKELVLTGQVTQLGLTVYDEKEMMSVVKMTDAWERGFDVTPFDFFNLRPDDPEELYPDLRLDNDFEKSSEIAKTCFLSVNGLIHPLTADSEGVYAIGANTNCREVGEIEMSLVEFQHVGEITMHEVKVCDAVNPFDTVNIWENGLYVKLPPEHVNKVVGLVVLGHLHILDGVYSHFDDDVIRINLRKLDLETKIINHHRALGLQNVGNYLKGGLGRVDMANPSLIEYVINNRNTFLFTLDVDKVYRRERVLTDEGLPCIYSSAEGLTSIAQYADGLIANYRQDYQDGLYCIQVPKRPSTRLLQKSTNYLQQGTGVLGIDPNSPEEAPALKSVEILVPA